ncbi:MAG: hypothetical protein JWN72_2571 [Thermoleophilia bacterium]|nr:hypothetical protein [Thermoleophilia bacterium]
MKIWAHVIATVVGLAVAGLIVFLVFGSASREGALQDGTAGNRATEDGALCGTVAVADINTPAARRTALKNAPAVYNKLDVQIEFPQAAGKAWLARVQASSGLCIDEVRYGENPGDTTSISMSTVARVSAAEASAYTGAALVAAGQKPLDGRNLSVVTFVGDQKRSIYFSIRAYDAYIAQRRGLGLGSTVADLIEFRRVTNFKGDIRINGWS